MYLTRVPAWPRARWRRRQQWGWVSRAARRQPPSDDDDGGRGTTALHGSALRANAVWVAHPNPSARYATPAAARTIWCVPSYLRRLGVCPESPCASIPLPSMMRNCIEVQRRATMLSHTYHTWYI